MEFSFALYRVFMNRNDFTTASFTLHRVYMDRDVFTIVSKGKHLGYVLDVRCTIDLST